MSSLLMDIPAWVREAPAGRTNFRRAVHCVLEAIAGDARLRELLCMKGGILMALHYASPRFTTDIDFSTPHPFDASLEKEVEEKLRAGLASTPESLGYDIDCRIQKWKVQPNREGQYITISMSIGYAEKDTPQHRRLMQGMALDVISIDYSFRETIPQVEVVEIGEDDTLRVYAITTLVAEKLRSLLQQPIRGRNRRQDVYDLDYLLQQRPFLLDPEYKREVLADLFVKCADRNITPTIESFDNPQIREMAAKDYDSLKAELPDGQLPPFDEIFERVANYYRSLPWLT